MADVNGAVAPDHKIEAMQPGTVAVVGMGKIGMPLAAQYLSAGWSVIGVDVVPGHVEALNAGQANLDDEPGVPDLIRQGHAEGRFEATLSHAQASSRADVVVMIVPLMLDAEMRPDYAAIDAATKAVGQGLRRGSLVIYETTLPIGDTRTRFGPMLEQASGLAMGSLDGFLLAFSPERVYSSRVLNDLGAYPKLVGGVSPRSAEVAASFYRAVLSAEVRELGSSETAELAKLAETTYRDINIAFANELAQHAEKIGIDVLEVISSANTQPYSHIHDPGIGVGGHCIPVYPRLLSIRAPEMSLPRLARDINDGQVNRALDRIEREIGSFANVEVLALGLTYRPGVRETAYSQGPQLVYSLRRRGARVSACDPLLGDDAIRAVGADPHHWGTPSTAEVMIVQTADVLWATAGSASFPNLRVVYDGRNVLRSLEWVPGVKYMGVGLPDR
jgi:nucleotide sugar dehydrogenase